MEPTRERESPNKALFGLTLFLLFLGAAIVLDASFARALHSRSTGGDALYFFKRQMTWVVVALGAMTLSLRFPYWRLRDERIWLGGLALTVVLLVVVLIPGIGIERNGSRRWLGAGSLAFQPSELAKVVLVIALARFSELWRGRIKNFTRGFIWPVAIVFVVGGLVAKEDLGTAITVIATGLLMIFMMGARPIHMLGLLVLALLGGVMLILIEPYRMHRIDAWLSLVRDPVAHHDGAAYQPAQGLIALGSGGVFGVGIGRGSAKHLYLPAEHTDYILATVGEETGLVGCLTLLALFAGLVIVGLNIAHRTRDWFGSLLAAGFTCMVGVQAMLNIAVVCGLVPCTGVPLPFISYGGSSVVFTALAVGMILNISQYPNGPVPDGKEKETSESRADGWRHRRPHLSRP